jgi:hypothetical protein
VGKSETVEISGTANDREAGSNIEKTLRSWKFLEASPGIEPGYKDLQSSASPLRHEASRRFMTEALAGI